MDKRIPVDARATRRGGAAGSGDIAGPAASLPHLGARNLILPTEPCLCHVEKTMIMRRDEECKCLHITTYCLF